MHFLRFQHSLIQTAVYFKLFVQILHSFEKKKNYLQKLNLIQMRHEIPLKVPGRVIFYCVVDIEIYTDLGNYTVHL